MKFVDSFSDHEDYHGLANFECDENKNLSNTQKEILLVYLTLRMYMQHVQKMLKVHEMKEPNEAFQLWVG